MSEDENAILCRWLKSLWRAACELFLPLPGDLSDSDESGDHATAETNPKNAKRLQGAGVQPRYHGGWRNLASIVSLGGSAMLGASFNFVNHSGAAFLATASLGISLMLLGVWATSKHDRLEELMRIEMANLEQQRQVNQERGRRIQKVADIYLAMMRDLDLSTVNLELKLRNIVLAGIGMLNDDEMLDVLDIIREHGLSPPMLKMIRDKLDPF